MGLFPAIHPEHLHSFESGVEAASATLFERAVTVITAPYGTPENVFKLATDFVTLIGSMPLYMDGTEVCRRVRANGIKTPIVLITSVSSIELVKFAFESGVNGYITKPVSADAVLSKIKAYVML